jgi:hypothetical protein
MALPKRCGKHIQRLYCKVNHVDSFSASLFLAAAADQLIGRKSDPALLRQVQKPDLRR